MNTPGEWIECPLDPEVYKRCLHLSLEYDIPIEEVFRQVWAETVKMITGKAINPEFIDVRFR